MAVRMGLLNRQTGWTDEAFERHWREQHAPLARQLGGLQAYRQNLVTERMQRGIHYPRGPWDFDGFSQLEFASGTASLPPAAETRQALIDDEARFLSRLHIVTVEPTMVIAPQESGLLKRISLLKRRADLDEAAFCHEWRVHADHVRRMPGVAGYRQNVVLTRERIKGQACGYDELPIDGIVELWFKDAATLEAAFGSPAGQTTMAHAQSFLAEITAFAVSERDMLAGAATGNQSPA